MYICFHFITSLEKIKTLGNDIFNNWSFQDIDGGTMPVGHIIMVETCYASLSMMTQIQSLDLNTQPVSVRQEHFYAKLLKAQRWSEISVKFVPWGKYFLWICPDITAEIVKFQKDTHFHFKYREMKTHFQTSLSRAWNEISDSSVKPNPPKTQSWIIFLLLSSSITDPRLRGTEIPNNSVSVLCSKQ